MASSSQRAGKQSGDHLGRIVLETNLILEANSTGDLVFHHQQSREMRSTEFHYLDSPAVGVIILAQPYEVPPLNPQGSTTELGC